VRPLAPSTPRASTWRAILFLSATLLVPACDDGDDVTAPVPTVPTVEGTVLASATGDPVAGAEVSIAAATATTGPDGRFELTGLIAGAATLRCIAAGFEDFEADITVPSGTIARDISMTRIELFEFGDFALYVPANVSTSRGILLALGGPDTRGFASGAPFGAPVPQVEAALQALGEDLRALAASHGLAVLGTSRAAMANGPDSDQLLLDVVQEAATLSGRPELASAPLLLYGMSGGGPEASGFTARNPQRVAGLFLKVPAGVSSLTSGEVLGVPTYVVQAEMDAFVDNAALALAFEANRRAGALWALALERGVPHHSLTPGHRVLTTNWMSTILDLRLGAATSDPLRAIDESSGWLGDPATGEVAPWASFAGDRSSASWLPSQETAERWETFVGLPSFSVRVDPDALIVHAGWVESLTATVLDENGNRIQEPVVTFTSDNEGVATVGADDLCAPGCTDFVYVIGVAQGKATITAEYRGVTSTAPVTVLPAFGSVKIDPAEATISVGGTVQLTARVLDENGQEIPNSTIEIEWACYNCQGVPLPVTLGPATVDENGAHLLVTGVVKGQATIVAGLPGPLGPDLSSTAGKTVITVQ
jgi:hypothetical protein